MRPRDENGDIWKQVASHMKLQRVVLVTWQASHLRNDGARQDTHSTWYTWQANKHADVLAGDAAQTIGLPQDTRDVFHAARGKAKLVLRRIVTTAIVVAAEAAKRPRPAKRSPIHDRIRVGSNKAQDPAQHSLFWAGESTGASTSRVVGIIPIQPEV